MNAKNLKIVVCGATGNQGGAVASALLSSGGWVVTTLTRDPTSAAARALADKGAEIVTADLHNMDALRNAFHGAYGVFGLTQPWSYETERFDRDAELRQAKNIIWAAIEEQIPIVVMSSIINPEGTHSGVSWIDSKKKIEELFKEYLPKGIIVRPSLYMENMGGHLLKLSDNVIKGRFAPHAKIPFTALADLGSIVAGLFEQPDKYEGMTINALSDLVSGNAIAGALNMLNKDQLYTYHPANKVWMSIFHRQSYLMRKYFEEVGSIYRSVLHDGSVFAQLCPAPTKFKDFISEWLEGNDD